MMFLRHRQRAITAVSAGQVIIPKRPAAYGTMVVGSEADLRGYALNVTGSWLGKDCIRCVSNGDTLEFNPGEPLFGSGCKVLIGTYAVNAAVWDGNQYWALAPGFAAYLTNEVGNEVVVAAEPA